jgi:predicted ATP-dependent Lon-type protease
MIGSVDRHVGEIIEEDRHLFEPFPEALGESKAFTDRVSAVLPGWGASSAASTWPPGWRY